MKSRVPPGSISFRCVTADDIESVEAEIDAGVWLVPADVSLLGHGVRSLALFGKPLMTDDTEIPVSPSSKP